MYFSKFNIQCGQKSGQRTLSGLLDPSVNKFQSKFNNSSNGTYNIYS